MHLATELFPNTEVTEAQYSYGVQHSTAVAPHIDQHRAESVKWAEENDAEVIMLVHPLQVGFLLFMRYSGWGTDGLLEIRDIDSFLRPKCWSGSPG